jgi:hypothetical protein
MDYHQQPMSQQSKKIAFVLGNGRSRLQLNLNELKKYGVIYGCNALYREFSPDYLIAVDEKMVREIHETGWQYKHEVWTNPNKGIIKLPGFKFFNPHKGWSSGPTALWLASTYEYDHIYIIGFDYQGIDGRFNNVYADTKNYKQSRDIPTYFGNWANQTEQVIRNFKKIQYTRVIEKGWFVPPNISSLTENFSHVTFEDLDEKFPGLLFK